MAQNTQKFGQSFYILHHFAHIDSSYRSRYMLFCHNILLMFMILVVIFVIEIALFMGKLNVECLT